MKKTSLDLTKLDSATRQRIERALAPRRDTVLSIRFEKKKIEAWKKAAEKRDEFLVDWVERHLDAALKEGKK